MNDPSNQVQPSLETSAASGDLAPMDAKPKSGSAAKNRPVALHNLYGSHKTKLVYLDIPMTAMREVRQVMYFLDQGECFQNSDPSHIKRFLREDADRNQMLRKLVGRHYTFTFIRNPGERAFACFLEKIQSVDKTAFVKIRNYLIGNYGLKFNKDSELNAENCRDNFRKYLRFVSDNLAGDSVVRKEPHWQLQSTLLENYTADVHANFIGLTEKFSRHMEFILKMAGIKTPLHEIPSFTAPPSQITLDEIIDLKITNLLKKIYRFDYILYNKITRQTAKLD